MNVTLLAHTPNPERLVATAARLCYSSDDVESLWYNMNAVNKAAKQIEMLREMGHESPFEHATFTFAIEDVSRSLLAQITRHRIASFSVRSQRYVPIDKPCYVMPESIAKDEFLHEKFSKSMIECVKAYRGMAMVLESKYLEDGMNAKFAEKKAIEDARYILPNACCTSMIVTMNARELMHFFRLRCCNRAQLEIREVADEMLSQCQEVAPTLFEYAGAPCVHGKCPEGRMSCGKPRKAEIDAIKEGAINNG